SQNTPLLGMPGARRAGTIATFARGGRDKMTLVLDPVLDSLGLWIEQLVAESTGKEGVGIVPISGEPLGPPEVYGNDRFFVYIHYRETDNAEVEAKLDALAQAGHPFLRIILNELVNLGEEFFLWEFATALIGALMQINPFDQPNVQESKTNTVALIDEYKAKGKLPEQDVILRDGELTAYGTAAAFAGISTLSALLKAHFARVKAGDYFAITQYIQESPGHDGALQAMRSAIRDRLKVATTTGYAPRFLHSTGQLHKGGGDNGVFIQITSDDADDVPIAGEPFSFSILKTA
ncbi:MAG: transaldolase, partial [Candidatus Hydrogenedentota bacterium]